MKKIGLCLSILFATIFLSGCEQKNHTVCTTVYPMQFLVERIGNPHVSACNISNDKAIQVASPRSNYKTLLKNSDALIYISGIEPYFDLYNDEIRSNDINYVDLGSRIYLYPFARYTSIPYANDMDTLNAVSYYDSDIFSNINVYKNDPNFWMDPMTMLSSAEFVRDYLIYLYPEYEDDFKKNYNELELELARLDADYQYLVNNQLDISIVSMTASFGYLQTGFGVQVYPISISKYGALPSESQLEIIKQKIVEDDVRYIVHEQNLNDEMNALYNELVDEFGLIPVEISNLSSLTNTQAKENKDYLTIMYENLSVLEGLGD